LGLLPVVVAHADRSQHAARRGGLEAVGHGPAAGLDVDLVLGRHAPRLRLILWSVSGRSARHRVAEIEGQEAAGNVRTEGCPQHADEGADDEPLGRRGTLAAAELGIATEALDREGQRDTRRYADHERPEDREAFEGADPGAAAEDFA